MSLYIATRRSASASIAASAFLKVAFSAGVVGLAALEGASVVVSCEIPEMLPKKNNESVAKYFRSIA